MQLDLDTAQTYTKSEEDNGVEIRISKAIQAVRTGQEPSMRRAADVYAAPYLTLKGRIVLGRKRRDKGGPEIAIRKVARPGGWRSLLQIN